LCYIPNWHTIDERELLRLARAREGWGKGKDWLIPAKKNPPAGARAGKKEGGWGEGIFARPRLKVFQNSAFGFSLKKVRISFSVRSKAIQKPLFKRAFVLLCSLGGTALEPMTGKKHSPARRPQ